MRPLKSSRPNGGFTLIELLVTVGIIALLAAIALPHYLKFTFRTKRAEAYIILNGAHKAQMSYFAGSDHYMKYCDTPPNCEASSQGEIDIINGDLGLGTNLVTNNGYSYTWKYLNADALDYGLELSGNINPLNDADYPFGDVVLIGANSFAVNSCKDYGAQPGIPYIYFDDITQAQPPC